MSPRLCRLTIVLCVFVVYAQTASFSFLEYDDPILITKNRLVNTLSLQHLAALWEKPHLNLYIPVTYTIWMGISAVSNELYGRLHPGLFHFANVLIHMENALLVYGILVLLLPLSDEDKIRYWFAPFFGALFFALHPVQVEAVAWATELKGVLSAFFFLVTIRLILYGKQTGKSAFTISVSRLVLATLAFLLAILSKPSTVVLPVFVFFLIRYVQRQQLSRALNSVLIFWLVLALADVILTRIAQPVDDAVSIMDRFFVVFYAVAFYFKKLLFPYPLSIDYGKSLSVVLSRPYLWLYPFSFVCFAEGLFYVDRRKKIFVCMLLVLICIAPVMGLVPFVFQRISTVADRYLYLAVFAASIGIAIMVRRYYGRIVILASILLIIFNGFVSVLYTAKWRNTRTIMQYALDRNPKSIVASHDLGVWLMKQGRMPDAIVFLKKALRLDPSNSRVGYDLAVSYACMGEFSAAARERDWVMLKEPVLGRLLSEVLLIIKKSYIDGKLPDFIKSMRDHRGESDESHKSK